MHFGFESNGNRRFAVTIDGTPRVESGMLITAVLRSPEDWSYVLGWRNWTHNEIAVTPARFDAYTSGGFILLASFGTAMWQAGSPPDRVFAIFALTSSTLALLFARKAIRRYRVKRLLAALKTPEVREPHEA